MNKLIGSIIIILFIVVTINIGLTYQIIKSQKQIAEVYGNYIVNLYSQQAKSVEQLSHLYKATISLGSSVLTLSSNFINHTQNSVHNPSPIYPEFYPKWDLGNTNGNGWQIETNDCYYFWLYDSQGNSNKVILPLYSNNTIMCIGD